MISSIISRLVILLFGTLYPAYASYKAVKTKNVKEYVKWMMYWIVFALFTCTETFTDVFLSWFPFYYEIKVILVLWLLSPATRGSSILYRKFVHPMLSSREQEIDEYISRAREQSYKQVLDLGSKGVNVLMQTAIKSGGGIVNQLRKSYSLSDLTDSSQSHTHEEQTETDGLGDLNISRKKRSHLTASTSSGLYFTEVDVRQDVVTTIKSTDDISSGYSSGEPLFNNQLSKLPAKEGLTRSGSISSTRSKSLRVTRSTIPKKTSAATDSDDDSEYESQGEDVSDVGNESKRANEIDVKCKIELKDEHPITSHQNPPSETIALIEHQTKTLPEQQDALTKLKNASTSMYKSKSVGSLNMLSTEPPITKPRAGKYNKKAAPLPPTLPETEKNNGNTENVSTIRATLVLKPGSIVPIKPANATSKEIVLRSPNLKNKKRSLTNTKEGSSFSRFLTLPKKFTFWHRDEEDEDDFNPIANFKRSSWYAELPKTAQLFLLNSKPISKSVENFHIESLTHSPKFRNKNKNLDPQAD